MSANLELQRVVEWSSLRGFANLFHKENRSWWCTRCWWVNALLWPAAMGILVGIMFFILPTLTEVRNTDEVVAAGGAVAYGIQIGISIFFRMGSVALALGAIVISQDLILTELQSGVTEWLLSKPVARRSYVLAKLAASALAILVLLVGLPSLLVYLLLSLRVGAFYAALLFLKGVGVLALHTLFYLTLTTMLGTIFTIRTPILGMALASAIGGAGIGGFIRPLLYITPWILGTSTEMLVLGHPVTPDMMAYPLAATGIWCVIFILVALWRFERTEF